MTKYLTFYPTPSGFIDVGEAVSNKSVPRHSCYATSLHDYLNLVNRGFQTTINTETFIHEFKTVSANLADLLYSCKITFDYFTALNFILHKTWLAYESISTQSSI